MKEKLEQIPQGAIIAVVVVAVLLAGYLGFKTLGGNDGHGEVSASDVAAHRQQQGASYQSQSGTSQSQMRQGGYSGYGGNRPGAPSGMQGR